MLNLGENTYNRSVGKAAPKLRLWRSAGLLLTYKCPAACEFCYYRCSPSQTDVMPLQTAMTAWQGMRELAGEQTKIHITGGEPFLYFSEMIAILEEARRRQFGVVDQIETNAFWADDGANIESTLRLLDSLGMRKLKISCDPFHQEYIPVENVRRLADIARGVLGPDRVLIRWQKYMSDPVLTKGLDWSQRVECFRNSLRDFPYRFAGRAADRLGESLANRPLDDIAVLDCSRVFLGAGGVHIDPLGNVFSGTCSGIIVGNVNKHSLAEIWRNFDPSHGELTGTLFRSGPAGLVRMATGNGFRIRDRYADKCHLCSDVRNFFFDRRLFAAIIGPVQCYSEGKALLRG
jgi:hypothetical protein